LYHPLTPFFVLFCHVVATSSEQDFQMLKLVASGLDGLTHLSSSIAKVQNLFHSFIKLSEGVVLSGSGNVMAPVESQRGRSQGQYTVQHSDSQINIERDGLPTDQQMGLSLDISLDQQLANFDPVWGLFDAQPTLDWLDADFSFP
jgi:hypothetical protein